MLSLQNLNVAVGTKPILKNINFSFEEGKIYAIMGPNGSGKSTLAYALMGHPSYTVNRKSKILINKKNIVGLKPNERAEKGLFLSFQSPLSLNGVKVYELLQLALLGKKDPLKIREEAKKFSKQLKINEELLSRSLNDGASGGEKKKLEVLQAAVLNKKYLIFDEVDTGVDVDALRTISEFLKKNRKDKTYIVITHYNRILKYLKPDRVLVLVDGKLVKTGNYTLAHKIEEEGYAAIQ